MRRTLATFRTHLAVTRNGTSLETLYDLTEWEDAEAAIRELHARGPEIERLYLNSKILPGELRALVMVSNCLEREFIHRQLATGHPLHMNVL